MPNFNARIRPNRQAKDGKTLIAIRVTHKSESRYIATDYHIEPEYFDNDRGRVVNRHPLAVDINIELGALELTYSRKCLKLEGRIKEISMNDLITFLNDTDSFGALDFFSVAKNRLQFLYRLGKTSSAKILEQTVNRVQDYQGGEKLPFVQINTTWLKGFESWYNINGSQNAAAIHLRNIRTLYNIAVDDYGLSVEYYPFRKFKIKTQQTIHRDISPQEIARLIEYKPTVPFHEIARDLWILSFFFGRN